MTARRCNGMPAVTHNTPNHAKASSSQNHAPSRAMDPAAIRSFCDATGASEAQATARLQAFGGNVEAAVNSFFGARSLAACASATLRHAAHPADRCGAAEDGADGGDDDEEVYEAAAAQPAVRSARTAAAQRCPKSLTRRLHSRPRPLRCQLRPPPLRLRHRARAPPLAPATCARWRTWRALAATTRTTDPSRPSSGAPRGALGAQRQGYCARCVTEPDARVPPACAAARWCRTPRRTRARRVARSRARYFAGLR